VNEELRAELLARANRDQTARKSLPPAQRAQQWEQVIGPVDRANTARMREVVAQYGWPGYALVGVDGAHAAWLLVQHAPAEFQEECLPLLEDAVCRDDAAPRDLAYLTDRVLMYRGEPQVYGTQYQVLEGMLTLWTVREPEGLDQRRSALGLPPEAENRARLAATERLSG
jgi:Family of unknown function (DUF6624)